MDDFNTAQLLELVPALLLHLPDIARYIADLWESLDPHRQLRFICKALELIVKIIHKRKSPKVPSAKAKSKTPIPPKRRGTRNKKCRR